MDHLVSNNMHIQEVLKEFESHNMVQGSYDHMVYLRLFEGCNLHCEHCFIPSNPKKINPEFYQDNKITEELVKFGKVMPGSTLYIQWHGGEPTLLGVDYLKNAIEMVEKDTRFIFQHGIQTNLMNFSDNTNQWVELYHTKFGGHVGISWDYGIRHTNIKSLTPEETNAQYEEKFWNNVSLAKEYGLQLYLVITATKLFFEHFKNPFDFFQMMVEKGITHLNFERITKVGNARQSWNRLGLSNKEYSHYMSKFFKAYTLFKNNHPEVLLNISPFDGLLRSVIGLIKSESLAPATADIWDIMSYKNQGYGCWSGACDTRFHTIDSNGYKHGCTALNSEEDNKNKLLQSAITSQKIVWVSKRKENPENTFKIQREERQQSCTGCEFLKICSSGCLSVEKFDESGECSGAKTLFKTIYQNVSLANNS